MNFLPTPLCGYPTQTCVPTQIPGPQGAAGTGTNGTDGLSCFTFTLDAFVMPAVDATVDVSVASSIQFAVGEYVWVEIAGEMQITAKSDESHMTLKNTGWTDNVLPGTNIPPSVEISPVGKSATNSEAGHLIYRALISQIGTDDPSVTVLENTIGAIVWARIGVGQYTGTLIGAFTSTKTMFFLGPLNNPANSSNLDWVSEDVINIFTAAFNNGTSVWDDSDDILIRQSIEIFVYP